MGLIYPIVDTLCDLCFRNRFFAVSCWTKFLCGSEGSVKERVSMVLTCMDNFWTSNAGEGIEG